MSLKNGLLPLPCTISTVARVGNNLIDAISPLGVSITISHQQGEWKMRLRKSIIFKPGDVIGFRKDKINFKDLVQIQHCKKDCPAYIAIYETQDIEFWKAMFEQAELI